LFNKNQLMKYILILLALFAACTSAEEKEVDNSSAQSLIAAKRSLDSIHLLTRKAASKEVTLESIEKKVEQLQGDVKRYSLSFTETDSTTFLEYDHKKQEETIEWMTQNGY